MRKGIAAERTHERSDEREFPASSRRTARPRCRQLRRTRNTAREVPHQRQTLRRANNRNGPSDPLTVPSAPHDPPFGMKAFQIMEGPGCFSDGDPP